MSEEELYKLLNIPYKPWIELTNEEIQLFENNNNYIKQLQQENTQLKQQLKDKDEKISKVIELLKNPSTIEYKMYGLECSRDIVNIELLLEILESNKED